MSSKALFGMVLLLLLAQGALAGTVYSGTLVSNSTFDIEGQPFFFTTYDDGTGLITGSQYRVILHLKDCTNRDKYSFCYESVTDRGEMYREARWQATIKVETLCDTCTALGAVCQNDSQCYSKTCLHGVCRAAERYCGDTFCEQGETCPADCTTQNAVRKDIPYTSTNIALEPTSVYYVNETGNSHLQYCVNTTQTCAPLNRTIAAKEGPLLLSYTPVDYKDNTTIPFTITELTKKERDTLEQQSGEISIAIWATQVPEIEYVTPQFYENLDLRNEIAVLNKTTPVIIKINDSQLIAFTGDKATVLVLAVNGENAYTHHVYWKKNNGQWQAYDWGGDKANLSSLASVQDLRKAKQELLAKAAAPPKTTPAVAPTPPPAADPEFSIAALFTAICLVVAAGVIFFAKYITHSTEHQNDGLSGFKFRGSAWIIIVLVLLGFAWYPFFFAALVYYLWNAAFTEPKRPPASPHTKTTVKEHIAPAAPVARAAATTVKPIVTREGREVPEEPTRREQKKFTMPSFGGQETRHTSTAVDLEEQRRREFAKIREAANKEKKNRKDELADIIEKVQKQVPKNHTSKDVVQETLKYTTDDEIIIEVIQRVEQCSPDYAKKIYADIKKVTPQVKLALSEFERVDSMDGTEFEEFVAKLFEAQGHEVQRTGKSGDRGADLIVKINDVPVAIQVKARGPGKLVNNKAVQEIYSATPRYKAQEGWVITNRDFTPEARLAAEDHNVQLWNRHKLREEYDKVKLRGVRK